MKRTRLAIERLELREMLSHEEPKLIFETVWDSSVLTPDIVRVSEFTQIADKVYFFDLFSYSGFYYWWSLHVTDGTTRTALASDSGPGMPDNIHVVGDLLFFETEESWWVSDGTPEGTHVWTEELPQASEPPASNMRFSFHTTFESTPADWNPFRFYYELKLWEQIHARGAIDDRFISGIDATITGNVLTNDVFVDGRAPKLVRYGRLMPDTVPGEEIVLISDSRLIMDENGTFTYDAIGTHDYLGAGETQKNTFQYLIEYDQYDLSKGEQRFYVGTATISVTGRNDPPTRIDFSTSGIPKQVAIGTSIGTFSTEDLDTGDSHTYELIENPDDRFLIDDDELQVARRFDPADASSYTIRVRSTDSGGASVESDFEILP